MKIPLQSEAFSHGTAIPKQYTGEGKDISPPLRWSDVPEGVQEFALICDDPDAPTTQPWVHWVIYAIPKDVRSLPEGVPADAELKTPASSRQGRNSWTSGRTVGYRGPMPPPGHGVHHYHFKLYALDEKLDLEPGADKNTLLRRMAGHVLAEGELTGTYQR